MRVRTRQWPDLAAACPRSHRARPHWGFIDTSTLSSARIFKHNLPFSRYRLSLQVQLKAKMQVPQQTSPATPAEKRNSQQSVRSPESLTFTYCFRSNENPPVEPTMNADPGSGEKSPPADVEPALQPALLLEEGSEDSKSDKYLHGMPLILMALSLMIGVLTVALDNSIICRQPNLFSPLLLTPKSHCYPKDDKRV